MNRIALAATLAVFGCGVQHHVDDRPSPDFVTWNGVAYFLDGDYRTVTQEEAQNVEDLLVSWLSKIKPTKYPEAVLRECLEKTTVHLQDDLIPCHVGVCIGLQRGTDLLIVKGGHCGYESPLAHEMMHRFQECAGSEYDPDLEHAEPTLWGMVYDVPGMLLCNR